MKKVEFTIDKKYIDWDRITCEIEVPDDWNEDQIQQSVIDAYKNNSYKLLEESHSIGDRNLCYPKHTHRDGKEPSEIVQINEAEIHNNVPDHYIRNAVEQWFNSTFNNISLDVYQNLFEGDIPILVRPNWDDLEEVIDEIDDDCLIEFLDDYSIEGGYNFDVIKEEVGYNFDVIKEEVPKEEIQDFLESRGMLDQYYDDNYPMWGTVFELKELSFNEKLISNAIELGLGIIESNKYFNDAIFVKSAGHCFYDSYWIPLYKSIFGDK